jgi:predicted alpha/beta superfamily hydrolase
MSGSFWWNDQDFLNSVMKNHSFPLQKPLIYMDSGTEGAEIEIGNDTVLVKN